MRKITYGTFDLLHKGHINLFKRIKADGNSYLIVGISTDKFNLLKNKKAHESFKIRKQNVLNTGFVDKVIKEKKWSQKINDIKKYNIDEFIIGDDWKGEFDFLKKYCNVKYLKRTPNISSTQLRKNISKLK